MSVEALREFEGARSAQLQRNEARRMRTLVNQARGDIHRSGNRWPFELTQNAHDPGPRAGASAINLALSFDGKTVIYEHDGKPFSMQDLAALQSGGSNKDFDSKITTGRFGTGFLLTHALAYQIRFEGIFETKTGFEQVHLNLDRSGDEERIYENTLACNAAISQAAPLPSLEGNKTARFIYATDNQEAAIMGMTSFSKVLPHLYGTCDHLGQVDIAVGEGQKQTFSPSQRVEEESDGVHIWEREVKITENGGVPKIIKALRIQKSNDSESSLVLVLEKLENSWRIVLPTDDFPRLFCRFPIRTSDFLPVNVVIDGNFDLSQERDLILMQEPDKQQIAEALGLLPPLLQFALRNQWSGGFKLARVGMPAHAFGDPLPEPLKIWWKATLAAVADNLARMPIVQMADGEYTRIAEPSPNADFIIPRFDLNQAADELDFEAVWQCAYNTKGVNPPALAIASDWTLITREWLALGVRSTRLSLIQLAELARGDAEILSDLNTNLPPLTWLSRFLNLVGQIALNHNCANILSSLLPDQNDTLKSPDSLRRDEGVEEELKRISSVIKLNVRGRLLSNALLELANQPEFPHLKSLLEANIPQSLSSHSVIEECIQELLRQLPDSKTISTEKIAYRDASIDLLRFLWLTHGANAADIAHKCPLIASDGSAIRWGPQRKAMAPVAFWHKSAQPFAKVYKEERILTEDYLIRFQGDTALVSALVSWDLAFADPLYTDTARELSCERFKAIADLTGCESASISNVQVSQIALLPTELIQRCQGNEIVAKALFGLVLNYVAGQDSSWEGAKTVMAKRKSEEVELTVFPTLWLADLKSKAWVPIQGETGFSNVMANASTLGQLLNPKWLEGNDAGIRLLARFFGFKELTLRLLATAPEDELRKQVESGLAMLVQTLGSDAIKYSELASELEAKKRRDEEKQRNRKFGFAVQDAIKICLELHNLKLVLVDCGYDYDVFLEVEEPIESGTLHLQLADYLLEVKATTTGEVRLTPKQAQTATQSSDRFVLCVVDLRGITQERMEADWTASDVESRTKLILGVGNLVNQPHGLVEKATVCAVGLRNESALRYGVPVNIWQTGISVSEWVAQIAVKFQAGQHHE
jgi:hypothetical protein